MVFFSFLVLLASASLPSDIDDTTAWKDLAKDAGVDIKTNINENLQIFEGVQTLDAPKNFYITVTAFQNNKDNAIRIKNLQDLNSILISRCFFKESTTTSVKADDSNSKIMIYRTCVYQTKIERDIEGGFANIKCYFLMLNDTTISECKIESGTSMIFYKPRTANMISIKANRLNFTENKGKKHTAIHAEDTLGIIQFSTFDSNTASSNYGIIYIYQSRFNFTSCNFINNPGKVVYNMVGRQFSRITSCYFTGSAHGAVYGHNIMSIVSSPLTNLQHYMSYACYASIAVSYRTPEPSPMPTPQPTASPMAISQSKIEPDYTKMFIYTKKRNRMVGIS